MTKIVFITDPVNWHGNTAIQQTGKVVAHREGCTDIRKQIHPLTLQTLTAKDFQGTEYATAEEAANDFNADFDPEYETGYDIKFYPCTGWSN